METSESLVFLMAKVEPERDLLCCVGHELRRTNTRVRYVRKPLILVYYRSLFKA
jgi:hypothetical protein